MSVFTKLRDPNWWIDRSLNDLYFFSRNVLCTLEDPTPGYKDLYKPTHGPLCRFLEKYAHPGQVLIILMPRGWVKSYIITVGWLTQRILRNLVHGKREMWVVANATAPNALEFLDKIKYNLQYNELLTGLFSKWLPENPDRDADRWLKDQIQISGNRIETGSAEANLVSRHFFGLVNDDLVNRENSMNRDQVEKIIDWWKLGQSLKHPKGIEIIPGTRWSMDDLYGYLIDKFLRIPKDTLDELRKTPLWEWHRGRYHLFNCVCWEDPVHRKGSTFPTLFPEKRLKEIEEEQEDRFGGQYMNDPLSMADAKFKLEWFARWREKDLPSIRTTFLLVDPTGKEKNESDYTGMVAVDAGVDKKLYVRYADQKRITDAKLVEWIVSTAMVYQPMMIGIEENKFSVIRELMGFMVPQLIRIGAVPDSMTDYVRKLPNILIELKHHSRPKPLRIVALQGWFEERRILLAHHGMELLIDQLLRFSMNGQWRDDIADALAYILDVVIFPRPTDPPRTLIVPRRMKMTAAEREKEDWEKTIQELDAPGGRMSPGDYDHIY